MRIESSQPRQQADGTEYYAKHKKVYPREVHGVFAKLRIIGVLILLGPYYLLPWIQWDGHQSVLFDLPARKFHIFSLTFWPQDFFYLAVLLIIAALVLFFITAIAGRVWCGFACPQTVWTEVFLWIERKIEGSRNQQMKLDQTPWKKKIWRKLAKHFLWITFSAWTGFTFVGFFTPITELSEALVQLTLGPWEIFWIIFYSFATYGNAGWMREQVCIYMCPYARFQSAMFDKNTLIISYNPKRGEPRGARRKNEDYRATGKGECVDCTLCVQVCPTGIDIRDGLQYQCIGCAACVDVCNEVMDKMNYPRQLISYTTLNALDNKKIRFFRPRILVYMTLLIAITTALVHNMWTRLPFELDVLRDRNTLFQQTHEGLIYNTYTLNLINMDTTPHTFRISVSGIPSIELISKQNDIPLAIGENLSFPVRIQVDPKELKKTSTEFFIKAQSLDRPKFNIEERARFIGSPLSTKETH